jgi:hypothetical protein
MTAPKYREFARSCLKWAGEASSDENRAMLLDLAAHWLKAVAAVDQQRSVSEPNALETRLSG